MLGGFAGAGLVDRQQHRLAPATFCAVFSTSIFSSCDSIGPSPSEPADDDAVAAGLDLQREAALHLGMVEAGRLR